jgi:hypothetical protein
MIQTTITATAARNVHAEPVISEVRWANLRKRSFNGVSFGAFGLAKV